LNGDSMVRLEDSKLNVSKQLAFRYFGIDVWGYYEGVDVHANKS